MSDGLRRSHFILRKASGRGVASQREEKTLLRQGTSLRKQILRSAAEAPGRTLVPALCPGRNHRPKHPGTCSSHAGGIKPALHSHLPQKAGGGE